MISYVWWWHGLTSHPCMYMYACHCIKLYFPTVGEHTVALCIKGRSHCRRATSSQSPWYWRQQSQQQGNHSDTIPTPCSSCVRIVCGHLSDLTWLWLDSHPHPRNNEGLIIIIPSPIICTLILTPIYHTHTSFSNFINVYNANDLLMFNRAMKQPFGTPSREAIPKSWWH